jgi:hypothetical protein
VYNFELSVEKDAPNSPPKVNSEIGLDRVGVDPWLILKTSTMLFVGKFCTQTKRCLSGETLITPREALALLGITEPEEMKMGLPTPVDVTGTKMKRLDPSSWEMM